MRTLPKTLSLLVALLVAGAGFARAADVVAPAPATTGGAVTPLTHDQFIATLARDLAAHFNLEGELQLELIRPWSPPSRVASAWTLGVVEYPSVASSSMLVRARILADGQPVTEVLPLVLHASLWRDAWVARGPLAVGAAFDPAQLDTRRVDLFRERDVLPASIGDRTYIISRGVGGGRTLTWRDISRRPLVRKGEIVEVSAADGLLVVTLKGLALENGAQGETVTIRNPESQKNFTAVVVDENRVQVRF